MLVTQFNGTEMKYEKAGDRFPYAVADTGDGPHFRWPDNGTLELTFTDHQEEVVSVTFQDVLGVKYQNACMDISGWAEDLPVEVIGSTWLADSCKSQCEDPAGYRHLIIGFNERGMILEVLFRSMNVEIS